MEKEVYILNKEQLDAYFDWKLEEHFLKVDANNYGHDRQLEEFRKSKVCPLPSPVKVLTEDEIDDKYEESYIMPNNITQLVTRKENYKNGYNQALLDLGIKKQQ